MRFIIEYRVTEILNISDEASPEIVQVIVGDTIDGTIEHLKGEGFEAGLKKILDGRKIMNLYKKVGQTEPGAFAHMIGDLLYSHGTALHKGSDFTKKLYCSSKYDTWHKQLTKLRHYLEGLAHERLKEEATKEHKWVTELVTETNHSTNANKESSS